FRLPPLTKRGRNIGIALFTLSLVTITGAGLMQINNSDPTGNNFPPSAAASGEPTMIVEPQSTTGIPPITEPTPPSTPSEQATPQATTPSAVTTLANTKSDCVIIPGSLHMMCDIQGDNRDPIELVVERRAGNSRLIFNAGAGTTDTLAGGNTATLETEYPSCDIEIKVFSPTEYKATLNCLR
ncbi:MAG TPA: hypothetical protein VLF20_05105, partial [Patescibacteria group bacterium]|nr:hypothetical protein [Patescibacteria group bacterium]